MIPLETAVRIRHDAIRRFTFCHEYEFYIRTSIVRRDWVTFVTLEIKE